MIPARLGLPGDPLWRARVQATISGTFRESVPWVILRGNGTAGDVSEVKSHGEILTDDAGFSLKIHPSGESLATATNLMEAWSAKRQFTLADTWEAELWLAEGSSAFSPHVWPPSGSQLWHFADGPSDFATYKLRLNHLESQVRDRNAFKYTRWVKRFFPGVKTEYAQWPLAQAAAEANELLAKEFPELGKINTPSCWFGHGEGHTWLTCEEENGLSLLIINHEPEYGRHDTVRRADAYTAALQLVLGRRMLCAYEQIHSPYSPDDWFRVYAHQAIEETFPRMMRVQCEIERPGCTASLIGLAARFFANKEAPLVARASRALWTNHCASGAGRHPDTQTLTACTALESLIREIDQKLGGEAAPGEFLTAKAHALSLLKSDAELKNSPFRDRLLQGVANANPPGDRRAQWERVMSALGIAWSGAGATLYAAWNDSRHKLAHGEASEHADPNEQLDRLSRLQGGLTTIIAAMTGYQGPVVASPLENKFLNLRGVSPELFRGSD